MKEKGAVRGLLASLAVLALLSAALGGAYSLSEKSWNEGWSLETLENNVNLVVETALSGRGGGARDNHSTDNLPADNCAADNASNSGFWDTHRLDAVPVVRENASVEDLPTAEEVENILFEWDVFENKRPPFMANFTTENFEDVFGTIKWAGLEYHFDENNHLHVDTPGWIYETPSERDDNEYWLANSTMKEGGGGSRNVLDFCRRLKKQGIASGIAILETENAYPHSKVVIPVRSGLIYSYATGVERGGSWLGNWYAVNVRPGEDYPWSGETFRIKSIALHWRLGEGDYVEWDYVLENGEPTMVWPENGQPVGWRTPS